MTSNEPHHQIEAEPLSAATGPGAVLRAAREQAGLSKEDVANKLFLRVSNIEEVEQDILDPSRPTTFIRGYVRSYAKLLGMDDAPLLAMFDAYHTTVVPPAKFQSFSKRVIHQTNDARWMMLTYVILLIFVAAFLLWWWQQQSFSTSVEENTATNTQTLPSPIPAMEKPNIQVVAPQPMAAAMPDPEPEPEPQSGPLPQSEPLPEAEPPAEAVAIAIDSAPSQQPGEEATAPETVAVEDPIDSDKAKVVFRFGSDCWVNITDATGEAIAYGVKTAGRVMTIAGVPPLQVTLGMPNNVSIEFNGEAVDMSRFPSGRTARFSLPMQD